MNKEILSKYTGKEVTVILTKTTKPYTTEIKFKGKLTGDTLQYYVSRSDENLGWISVSFNIERINLIAGDGTGNNIVITLK